MARMALLLLDLLSLGMVFNWMLTVCSEDVTLGAYRRYES